MKTRELAVAEPITLTVIWKGNVPGLSEHRISVGAFGDPLRLLLVALRRIASTRVSEAIGGRSSGVGRLPETARQLDIELSRVVEGSGGLQGQVPVNTPIGQDFPLFDLAELSSIELVDAIRDESQGNLRNAQVRTYLKAIPLAVTEQVYRLYRGQEELRSFTIGNLALTADLIELPYLYELTGRVIGVGFEPGRNQISFRDDYGSQITVSATPRQVNRALEWRSDPVRALILQSDPAKLLRLQLETDIRPKLDVEEYVFTKWSELLRRLAQ
jgi:hypothetical protein